MQQIITYVSCAKKYVVLIEKIKTTKEKVPSYKKNGDRVTKKGVPQNKMIINEIVLESAREEFLSKYNAQARIDNINFDSEEKMRFGILTRARLGE